MGYSTAYVGWLRKPILKTKGVFDELNRIGGGGPGGGVLSSDLLRYAAGPWLVR
jgi:hypothetical protein